MVAARRRTTAGWSRMGIAAGTVASRRIADVAEEAGRRLRMHQGQDSADHA